MSEIWVRLTSKSSSASIWLCRMGIPFSSFSTVMVRMAPSALIQKSRSRKGFSVSDRFTPTCRLSGTSVCSCSSGSNFDLVCCVFQPQRDTFCWWNSILLLLAPAIPCTATSNTPSHTQLGLQRYSDVYGKEGGAIGNCAAWNGNSYPFLTRTKSKDICL